MLTSNLDYVNLLSSVTKDNEIEITATIGAPVSKDISIITEDFPTLRTSYRPLERAPEISNISIHAYNVDNLLSTWNSSGIFYNKAWPTCSVSIKLAPKGMTGLIVYTGILQNILSTLSDGIVELVLTDAIALLKRKEIPAALQYTDPDSTPDSGDETGYRWEGATPCFIVRALLIEAGLEAYLDTTSFIANILEENLEGFRLDEYQLGGGTFFSVMSALMTQASSGIRWNSAGAIEYFKYRPENSAVAVIFDDTKSNVFSISIEDIGNELINAVDVSKSDGAGATEYTTNSPITDTVSIASYGEIYGQAINTSFSLDYNAEQIAYSVVFFYSQPHRIINVKAPLGYFVLELADTVRCLNSKANLDIIGIVFDKKVSVRNGTVELRILDTVLTNKAWLYLNNNQDLDDSNYVW